MQQQLGELPEVQDAGVTRVQHVVLQRPCVVVRDEHGIQTGAPGRQDV